MGHLRLVAAVSRALSALGTPRGGEAVVCALSGGADSVALLDALTSLARSGGFRVVAAHLDHGLRPGSSADAAFCGEVCGRLGVELRTGRADVRARAGHDRRGLEDAGRRERYAFLRSVRESEGAAAIAVAHTRDDQAETVLLRLLRGTGTTGLGAMRPRAGDVIRPLLALSRADVLTHLRECGLPWREDPSNADPELLRNRVRHELLPYLERRFNPSIRETLARTAAVAAEEAGVLAALGARLARSVANVEGDGVTLSRTALAALPAAEARLAVRAALETAGGLKDVRPVHLDRLVRLARAQDASGRRLPLPGGREAVVRFASIRVERRRPAPVEYALPLPVPGVVELPDGRRLRARGARGPAVSGAREAVIAAPREGLEVRTRRPGDRVPAARGEVSLKRFLIGRRVPADLRGELPLVAAGGRVLWVPGQAAAAAGDRFVRVELLPPRARHNQEGA